MGDKFGVGLGPDGKPGEGRWLRQCLAGNHGAPADVFGALAEDPCEFVRADVAANPCVPGYLLQELARDTSRMVRMAVAGNYSAPHDVVRDLLALSYREDKGRTDERR